MNAYYEYEDGTFWAIRTEGPACYTAWGSKYCELWPDAMLKAGSEEAEHLRMPPNAAKTVYNNPEEAEREAGLEAAIHSGVFYKVRAPTPLPQDEAMIKICGYSV